MEKNYSNIKLSSLTGLFCNSNALEYLKNYCILTVGDLLTMAGEEEFNRELKSNKNTYKDVINAVRLLKCKYLDIDPLVTIEDGDSILEFGAKIGLSTKAIYALARKQVTIEDLISIIKNGSAKEELAGAYNLGEKGINEIVFKTSIVVDYYSRYENSNFTINLPKEEKKSEVEEMYCELLKIRNQANDLVSNIDNILDKLVEKMYGQGPLDDGNPYVKRK